MAEFKAGRLQAMKTLFVEKCKGLAYPPVCPSVMDGMSEESGDGFLVSSLAIVWLDADHVPRLFTCMKSSPCPSTDADTVCAMFNDVELQYLKLHKK